MSVVFLSDSPAWCQPLASVLRDQLDVSCAVSDTAELLHQGWEPSAAAKVCCADAESLPTSRLLPEGCRILVNRMSARPGGDTQAAASVFRSLISVIAFQSNLSSSSPVVVVNGEMCHAVGASKVLQASLMAAVGAKTPRTVLVTRASWQNTLKALHQAEEAGSWLLKPNVGGKGAGIVAISKDDHLQKDSSADVLESTFGPDGIAVLQRVVDSPDKLVHRVELVNYEAIYVAHVPVDDSGSYNNCVSDVCTRPKRRTILVEKPPSQDEDAAASSSAVEIQRMNGLLSTCSAIARACQMQLGSIEYLLDRHGEAWFIDINPVSTVLKEAEAVIGVNPMLLQARWLASIIATTSA